MAVLHVVQRYYGKCNSVNREQQNHLSSPFLHFLEFVNISFLYGAQTE